MYDIDDSIDLGQTQQYRLSLVLSALNSFTLIAVIGHETLSRFYEHFKKKVHPCAPTVVHLQKPRL